jgi:peptidoglycan/LPS O-acetylase OafA/YrhL
VVARTNWPILAVLRFALAWIVLACHLPWFTADHVGWVTVLGWFGGKAAVVGFLMVSGYSIASSLSRGESGFYRRRFLRIYPLYFFAVLFATVLERVFHGHLVVPGTSFDSLGWRTTVGNFLMVQTFVVKPIPFDGPVWSLSIEASFYAIAPFLFRLRRPWLVALIVFSAVCFLLPRHDNWGLVYRVLSYLNALRFLWCWVLGFLLWRDRGPFVIALAVACTPLMLGWVTRDLAPLCVVTYVASLAVILAAPYLRVPKRVGALLDYLGDLSYPLYLFHLPVFILVYGLFAEGRPLVLVALALLVSALVYEAVDNRLKRGVLVPLFFPGRRRPAVQAAPAAAAATAPAPGFTSEAREPTPDVSSNNASA